MKLLLFLCFPLFAVAQNRNYTGIIVNSVTKERISFATVWIKSENIGINADEDGHFLLNTKSSLNDTLVISCIGFYTLSVPTANFPINMQFELIEKNAQLGEIFLKTESGKSSVVLNDFSNCGINYYTTSNVITKIAQRFRAPTDHSVLTDLYLCKLRDNAVFRIRIYTVDSILQIPGNDITDTIIEVRSGQRRVHIELQKHKIYLPGKDFFVAVEWIKTGYNLKTERVYFNGVKTSSSHYSPSISYTKDKNKISSVQVDNEVWQQDYNGKWIAFYPANARLLISATVKF